VTEEADGIEYGNFIVYAPRNFSANADAFPTKAYIAMTY